MRSCTVLFSTSPGRFATHLVCRAALFSRQENICKLILTWNTFVFRFYAWHLFRQGADKATVARWNNLKTALGTGRKLFRLFKPIEFGKGAIAALNVPDDVLRVSGAMKQIGYLGYYLLEMFVYLHQIGFITLKNQKKIADTSFKFWAGALTVSILSGLYKLRQVQGRIEMLQRNSKLVKASTSEKDAQRAADLKFQEKTLGK